MCAISGVFMQGLVGMVACLAKIQEITDGQVCLGNYIGILCG